MPRREAQRALNTRDRSLTLPGTRTGGSARIEGQSNTGAEGTKERPARCSRWDSHPRTFSSGFETRGDSRKSVRGEVLDCERWQHHSDARNTTKQREQLRQHIGPYPRERRLWKASVPTSAVGDN